LPTARAAVPQRGLPRDLLRPPQRRPARAREQPRAAGEPRAPAAARAAARARGRWSGGGAFPPRRALLRAPALELPGAALAPPRGAGRVAALHRGLPRGRVGARVAAAAAPPLPARGNGLLPRARGGAHARAPVAAPEAAPGPCLRRLPASSPR